MKKLLLPVLALICAVSLSACVLQPATPAAPDDPVVSPPDVSDTWLKYQNQKLGFEIYIPKKNDDGAIRTIASGDALWLVAENSSYLSKLPQFKNSASDFDKVAGLPWAIVVKTANNDQELDQFIKNMYGADCNLGAKIPSGQSGVFDVQIANRNERIEEGCWLNYAFALKYSPAFHCAAAWTVGQAPTFINSEVKGADGNGIYYDQDMAKSFKFVEPEKD
ncbi:MAG: hypothetical protein V1928_00635 [Parcubacteria group bacterium]